MTKSIKTNIRFDGEVLKDHLIDVDVLTKSLLGLSSVINAANKIVNDNQTEIKISVNARVEQNCFELLLQFDMAFIEQAKDFLTHENTVAVKNLLEWIGIIGAGGVGTVSVWKLFKVLNGKKITQEMITQKTGDTITINGSVTINREVYNIYNDSDIRKNSQRFLSPLGNEGIDSITFEDEAGNIEEIRKPDVEDFISIDIDQEINEESDRESIVNETVKWVILYKPVLSEDSTTWEFLLDGKPINIGIEETSIARDAMTRGEVRVGDTYKIRLEERQYRTPRGQTRTKYKALEVIEFSRGSADFQRLAELSA